MVLGVPLDPSPLFFFFCSMRPRVKHRRHRRPLERLARLDGPSTCWHGMLDLCARPNPSLRHLQLRGVRGDRGSFELWRRLSSLRRRQGAEVSRYVVLHRWNGHNEVRQRRSTRELVLRTYTCPPRLGRTLGSDSAVDPALTTRGGLETAPITLNSPPSSSDDSGNSASPALPSSSPSSMKLPP